MHKGVVTLGVFLISIGVVTSVLPLRTMSIAKQLTYENGSAYINGVYYGQLIYVGTSFDYRGWKIYASTAKQNIIGIKESYAITLPTYHGLDYINDLRSLIDAQEEEWEEEQQQDGLPPGDGTDGTDGNGEPPANQETPRFTGLAFGLVILGLILVVVGLVVKKKRS